MFDSALIPTLVDYYGSQHNPFELEPKVLPKPGQPKEPSIVDLMQELMNQLCPQRMYKLDSTERFVVIVSTTVARTEHSLLQSTHPSLSID